MENQEYKVSKATIDPSNGDIEVIKSYPHPNNVKEMQSFVGLCLYFRKFVLGFSLTANPLCDFTKDGVKYFFSEECQKSFVTLKGCLT